MTSILQFFDFFVHLDTHIEFLVASAGVWSYLVLWVIVFAETGFVVTPFLPGDSLIFVSGSLAALGLLHPGWLILVFLSAAILGDTINYTAGQFLGKQVLAGRIPIIKQSNLDRTYAFYEKYGGKTIILSRFVPIVRTFAPFVAGIGAMNYRRFIIYNVVGGGLWAGLALAAGYFFGQLPFIQDNFSLVVPMIILISLLPLVFEWVSNRRQAQANMLNN